MLGMITNAIETQEIFYNILKQAEEEVEFYTDGCKLLIEAFSSLDDVFVFTITKYVPDKEIKKKKLVVKRKSLKPIEQEIICRFDNFDVFCEFCKRINHLHIFDIKKLAKNSILYVWKDFYYLIIKNVNNNYEKINLFYSLLLEFGKTVGASKHFEYKLLEHGKTIIKKNAISVGIKYFS